MMELELESEICAILRKQWPEYPLDLKDIAFGIPFQMLNYDGIYIRVKSFSDFGTIVNGRFRNPLPFNDDGIHVPVVCIQGENTGNIFHMHKMKPIRIWNGWMNF